MAEEREHEHQWSDWEMQELWRSEGIFIRRRRQCRICGEWQVESLD